MTRSINHQVADMQNSPCLRAAEIGDQLRQKIEDFKKTCSTSGLSERNYPCEEMKKGLEDLISNATSAYDDCPKKAMANGDCGCVEAHCPMATAGMAVASIGMSIAALKLHGSAIHLRSVA